MDAGKARNDADPVVGNFAPVRVPKATIAMESTTVPGVRIEYGQTAV